MAILSILLAYLLGSIPFGYLLVKSVAGKDVRETGSGSIGATNVMRTAGPWRGILTFLFDVGKGYLAVALARKMEAGDAWVVAIAALAAVLGHIFPLFLKFKGGKGVATGVGVYLGIAPAAVGAVLIIFVVVVSFWRYISLGSILATAAFPFFAYGMSRGTLPSPILWGTFLGAALIVAKHHENVGRLLKGKENKFTVFSKQK